jgi:hypothetical protein
LVYARGKGNVQEISKNIGRCVKKRPNTSEISFLDRNELRSSKDGDQVSIKSINLKTNTTQSFGYSLPGSQDLIWIDKNHLLMAKGNEIFIKNVKETDWHSLGKIESSTHHNITRMAYSPELNKLVFVMNRK